ncbi:MAG: hypothetical protein M3680_06865 [Myxococcota bacterium]|nr:hypothetical protein [Myxococcota bacterium]
MKSLLLATLITTGLGACAGSGHATYSGSATVTTPNLVYIEPEVQVIADYHEPVFYTDSYYWRYEGGTWYRSNNHVRGWVRVDVNTIPVRIRRIDRPAMYVRYRGEGRVRGGGNVDHRDHRDHRDHQPPPVVVQPTPQPQPPVVQPTPQPQPYPVNSVKADRKDLRDDQKADRKELHQDQKADRKDLREDQKDIRKDVQGAPKDVRKDVKEHQKEDRKEQQAEQKADRKEQQAEQKQEQKELKKKGR